MPKAPSKPSARTLRAQRISGTIHPLAPSKTFRPEASTSDSFLESKRDKRLIKHSAFVSRVVSSSSSRVSKSSAKSPSGVSKTRRRRTEHANLASLDVLADALPDIQPSDGKGKINHKSLRSKKGALRRKETIVKGEMARFGASMAALQRTQPSQPTDNVKSQNIVNQNNVVNQESKGEGRWAALRGYIASTMKQNPAFESQ